MNIVVLRLTLILLIRIADIQGDATCTNYFKNVV